MEAVRVMRQPLPVDDTLIAAVSRMFDDRSAPREPTHSQIEFHVNAAGLQQGDPRTRSQPVGKSKRVRGVLSWGLEYNEQGASDLVHKLLGEIRACGGFRRKSPNYIGDEAVQNARAVFAGVGFQLSEDGELRPTRLEHFHGPEVTEALHGYARRARTGAEDAALVAGTGKDLLEATAAHVSVQMYGGYDKRHNFPTLLGQAFTFLGLATPQYPKTVAANPQGAVEIALYQLGCAVNQLRNRAGTGHGRPFPPPISVEDSRIAVEAMGLISELLLRRLSANTLQP